VRLVGLNATDDSNESVKVFRALDTVIGQKPKKQTALDRAAGKDIRG